MTTPHQEHVLIINTGSSSIKVALFRPDVDGAAQREATCRIERIGRPDGHIQVWDKAGHLQVDERGAFADHQAALAVLLTWLQQTGLNQSLAGVGHRVVHGGPTYTEPQIVTESLIAAVRALVPFDPEHLPQAIAAIEAIQQSSPGLPQIACFDTAFHRGLPRVAQLYGLPREFADEGLLRYGFHGLSYESIVHQLTVLSACAGKRIVIAHLGNGASMAAVLDGQGIETTMGFTPTGGLVMGTRSGDLDPGVLLYLQRRHGLDANAISDLVNRRAGMLGVSGSSSDMRDLLAAESHDPRAAEAIALFCYHTRKHLGALVAVLGGLDTLVFTAGVGEHAAPVRARICAGFAFLGLHLDLALNEANAPIISRPDSTVTVRVMQTDEEMMIARHTVRLLQRGDAHVRV